MNICIYFKKLSILNKISGTIASLIAIYTFIFQSGIANKYLHEQHGNAEKIIDFPENDFQKKIINEYLAYIQIELELLNEIYGSFLKGIGEAGEYNKYSDAIKYQYLSNRINFYQKEISNLSKKNQKTPEYIQQNLTVTPLSAAGIYALYDQVKNDAHELSKTLDFLLTLLNPHNQYSKISIDKWLSITREIHRQNIFILSYTVCELLLPINRNYLIDFRKYFLPKLTFFEGNLFNFNIDKTQIQQFHMSCERNKSILNHDLESLFADINTESNKFKNQQNEINKKNKTLGVEINNNNKTYAYVLIKDSLKERPYNESKSIAKGDVMIGDQLIFFENDCRDGWCKVHHTASRKTGYMKKGVDFNDK